MEATFVFGGEAGQLLAEFLQRDIDSAKLSRSFRTFYRVRPFLPIFARQWLQRIRNRKVTPDPEWYLPKQLTAGLESISHEPVSVWPDAADYALVLTHDVETRDGLQLIPGLAAIEEELGFRSSWNVVPYKYKIDRRLLADLKERGHEVGIHGYNHDGRLFLSKRIFDSRVPAINRAIEELGAVGFRAPMVHRNLTWLQQLRIEYDSSCFDVDPFQAMPGGVSSFWPCSYGKFVELPYTLPQDHTLLVTLKETTDRIWRRKLNLIRRWHGMALVLTHPDYLDSPSRLDVYRGFLQHIRDESAPWHPLAKDMARWYRQLAGTAVA